MNALRSAGLKSLGDGFRSSRARGALTVAVANGANNLVAFAGLAVAARLFGPARFGELGLAFSAVYVLTLVFDFGQDVSLVRLYGRAPDPGAKAALAWRFLQWKVVFVAAVLVASVPAGSWLAGYGLFRDGTLLTLTITSAALFSVWKTLRAIDQARSAFRLLARHVFVYGAARLAALALVLTLGVQTTRAFILALFVAPLAILIAVGVRDFHKHHPDVVLRWDLKLAWPDVRAGLAYGKWIAVSAISYNAFVRLPQASLAALADRRSVGIYSAALTFLGPLVLLNDALRTVLLPEAARIDTAEGRDSFRERLLRFRVPFFLCGAAVIAALCAVQVVFLGDAYGDSVAVFSVMGSGVLVVMYLGFFNSLVHSHGRPAFEAANNAGRLLLLAAVLWTIATDALTASVAFAGILIAGEIVAFVTIRRWDSRPWQSA